MYLPFKRLKAVVVPTNSAKQNDSSLLNKHEAIVLRKMQLKCLKSKVYLFK